MDIEKDEARSTLDNVNALILSTKQQLAHGPAGVLLIVWGLIWFVCFLGVHLQPRLVNWLPPLGCGVGMAALWICRRFRVETRGEPRPGDGRIGIAWLVLTAYAVLWMVILHPQRPANPSVSETVNAINCILAFFASAGMFGYVIMGLWFGRFWVILGVTVTLLIVFGLFALPQWFLVWMAFVGGGALIFSGVMVKRLWVV